MAESVLSVAWMGIDPGQKGGIALLTGGRAYGWEMPELGGWVDLCELLRECRSMADEIYVAVEHVHSMPTDSAQAAFTFGMGVGATEALCVSMGMHLWRVAPTRWRRLVGIAPYFHTTDRAQRKRELKRRSMEMAKLLYPEAIIRSRWTEGVAEALLIATACRRLWGGDDHEA